MRNVRRYGLIRPIVLAVVLALPGAAVLAAPMDVHTRSLEGNTDNLGRAGGSVYTDSRDAALAAQQSQAGEATWDKTKAGAEHAWDKTKAVAATPPTVPPDEPQRYGRAGGFIGSEQFEVPQPGVMVLPSAPENAEAVKAGEVQWGYTDRSAAAASATRQSDVGSPTVLPSANAPAENAEPYNYSAPAADANGQSSNVSPAPDAGPETTQGQSEQQPVQR